MTPDEPAFRSDVFYSVQNEDYRTELAVLEQLSRPGSVRVLMVASSGENALSVLAARPRAEIHAVDTNPAQVHLVELRRTAAQALPLDAHLRLLGAGDEPPGALHASGRLAEYDRVRDQLPAETRTYWDARRDEDVAFGLHFVGRNDVLMRAVGRAVGARGFAPLERALRDDELPAWTAAYAEVMTVSYFRDTFGIPTEAGAQKLAGLAVRTAACHFRALQATWPRPDYFLTTVFGARYADGDEGVPAYLSERGYASLRQPGVLARLHLHVGSLFDQAERLARDGGPFDLISLSNIVDWLDDAELARVTARLGAFLTPGGAVLARSASGTRAVSEIMSHHLETRPALDEALAGVERGPWFRAVAVGFRAHGGA
jgi:S-adenosylmethionine-diacylglycerol 3-amino-3-carboxypropyl transferase